MPVITSTVEINAAPEAVWHLLSDVARYAEWVVPTDEVLATPQGEMGVGATYRDSGGVGPFKGKTDWTVLAFDVPNRQVHEGDDGMVRSHLTLTLTPTSAGGTNLHQRIELTPRWYIAPIFLATWPLFMRRETQAAIDQTAANVKRLLEAAS
jgi:uncharacterized protein YndB with AHSA1/START domain